MKMQSMRIRANLLDGRVAGLDHHFPLDSILAAEYIRKHHPDNFYNPPPPGDKTNWIEPTLPFEKRGKDNKWYWACSFNQIEPTGEYITYWHRRFDDNYEQYIDFKGKRGKVDETSGRFKAYRSPLNILLIPFLEWYAVGDIKAVWDLCKCVTAIGKKTSQGYGIVDRWEVTEWDEDWSETRDGLLTRALYELPDGVQGRKAVFGMRPPYWQRENQAVVWI